MRLWLYKLQTAGGSFWSVLVGVVDLVWPAAGIRALHTSLSVGPCAAWAVLQQPVGQIFSSETLRCVLSSFTSVQQQSQYAVTSKDFT